MRSILRCAASISSTRAGVTSSSRRRPTASPYCCLTSSSASCRIGAESSLEYLLSVTYGWQSFRARPEAANDADLFPFCPYAEGQACWQRECLAAADRLAAEIAVHEPFAGHHHGDREAPVAHLDLVADLQRGRVEETEHVVVEQPNLTGGMAGTQDP